MPETEVRSGAVDQATELSEEVFASVESGQRAAIGAVRKFVDTVDDKLPSLGDEHPSRRQDIIDAALEMADQLVHTEYDFLRKVAHSAGKALSRPDEEKLGASYAAGPGSAAQGAKRSTRRVPSLP